MKVINIFESIEGEGPRAGLSCIFIRLAGCNLKCKYCDTKFSWQTKDNQEKSITTIINEIKKFKSKRISITGGEPLLHKDLLLLIQNLEKLNYEVYIETNGSQSIKEIKENSSAVCVIDYKLPYSGMEKHMDNIFLQNLQYTTKKDVVKFVIATKKDIETFLQIQEKIKIAQIFISPVYKKIKLKVLANLILKEGLSCKLQVQLHKLIWNKRKKGV